MLFSGRRSVGSYFGKDKTEIKHFQFVVTNKIFGSGGAVFHTRTCESCSHFQHRLKILLLCIITRGVGGHSLTETLRNPIYYQRRQFAHRPVVQCEFV